MTLYQIRVEIYEAATGYQFPIVVHEFNGRDRAEAMIYHDAHRQSDKFLRECEDKECFGRNVACKATYIEGWITI